MSGRDRTLLDLHRTGELQITLPCPNLARMRSMSDWEPRYGCCGKCDGYGTVAAGGLFDIELTLDDTKWAIRLTAG